MRQSKGQRKREIIQAVIAAGCSALGVVGVQGQTVASWLNPVDGTWTDVAKWSSGTFFPNNGTPLPGDTYDALIAAAGSYTITLNSNVTVNQLTLGSANLGKFYHTAGTLQAGTINLSTNSYRLRGGTIKSAWINGAPGISLAIDANTSTSTFDGVTLGIDVIQQNITGSVYPLAVRNGLTLVNKTLNAGIWSEGTQTFGGVGTIALNSAFIQLNNSTLTIGSGLSIRNLAGTGGVLGSGMLINQGTLTSAVGLQQLTLAATNGFFNQGWVQNSSNGNLFLSELHNAGTITQNGGRMWISGDHWTNSGTISLTNGTLQADGTFTAAALQSINRSGGTVEIVGTIDNTAQTVALDSFSGAWPLRDLQPQTGTVQGGTITAINPSGLWVPGGSNGVALRGMLDSTALATDIQLAPSAELRIKNVIDIGSQSIRLGGAGTIASSGTILLRTEGSGQILGNGSIVFIPMTGVPQAEGGVIGVAGNGTLSIGPGVTIIAAGAPGVVGTSGQGLVNQGTISSGNSAVTVQGNWLNTGTMEAKSGGTLNLSGSTSTANLGQFINSGGKFQFQAAIDNIGQTLALNSNIGGTNAAWFGSISGGTITTTLGNELRSGNVTLSGTTLAGDVIVDGGLQLLTSLTLANGRVMTNGSSVITGANAVSVNGSGEVIFNGAGNSMQAALLTLGSGITVRSGTGSGTIGDSASNTINHGTILAQTAGKTLNLRGNWSNDGALIASGGNIDMGGTFSTVGSIASSGGGSLMISGFMKNAGSNLIVDSAAGTLHLVGNAVISGGTITTAGGKLVTTLSSSSPTLRGTVLNGDIDVVGAVLNVQSGLTLQNGHRISLAGRPLSFVGAQDVAGNGEFVFDSAVDPFIFNDATVGFGSGITIRTGLSGGTLGSFNSPWINHGTIAAQTAGKTLTLYGNWSNDGFLTLSNGTLNLGGAFSRSSIQGLQRSAGTLAISGTMNNQASTFAVNSSTGSVRLLNGTIDGGSLATTAGSELIGAGTLSNLNLSGTMRVQSGTLSITNGTTFAGTDFIIDTPAGAGNAALRLPASASLSSGSDITFSGGSSSNSVFIPAGTLTIASGSAISALTANGDLWPVNSDVINVVNQGTLSASTRSLSLNSISGFTNNGYMTQTGNSGLIVTPRSGTSSFANAGTITANSGGSITLFNTAVGTNTGQMTAQSGSLFFIGAFANSGTITSSGGTVLLASGWSSTGTLAANSGTFLLGAPSGSIGNITATNSYISFTGSFSTSQLLALNVASTIFNLAAGATLNNAGQTLQNSASTIRWQLGGGTISGGTVTSAGAGSISAVQNFSTLNNVVLETDVFASDATLTLANIPAFTGRNLTMANRGAIVYASGSLLDGSNTVAFSSGTLNAFTSNSSLTIGPAVTVKAINASGSLGAATLLVNQGTISATGPGGVSINATTFTNQGTMRATNGGTLGLGGYWTNAGTIASVNSVLNLGGTFSAASMGTFNRSGGTVNLTGTYLNTGTTLTLNDTTGSWYLNGGTISGGTVTTTGSASLLMTAGSGTLDAVTLNTDLIDPRGSLFVTNGLLLGNRTVTVSASTLATSMSIAGPIGGTGTILLNGSGPFAIATLNTVTISSAATFGSSISARAETGWAQINGPASVNTLVNEGTITATGAGSLGIGRRINNIGTIEAVNGGRVMLSGATLSNQSGGSLSGGTWKVAGPSTLSFGSASITINNATVELNGLGSTLDAINSLRTNLGRFTITNDRDFTSVGSLTNSGTIVIGPKSVLRTTGDLFNTGTLDLAGGTVLVDYPVGAPANAAALLTQLGTNIITSNSLSNPALRVAYADNIELGTAAFAGQGIDLSTMIFTMTFAGDSDLDGAVNTTDFNRLAGNFGAVNASWLGSDFDYNHTVDSIDFALFLTGYGQKLPTAAVPALGATVPEPAIAGLLVLAGIAGGRRRVRV